MTGRDDDRTWAELVDAFHASPDEARPDDDRRWPEAENVASDDDDHLNDPTFTAWVDAGEPAELDVNKPADARSRYAETNDGEEAADHFEPLPPPPIPRGDAISRAAWTGVLGSPALFVLLSLLQWAPPDWLTIALICGFVGGFVVLVARLRGHQPDDPDNGAVV